MAGQRITTRKLNVFTPVAQPRFSKNVLVGRRWKFNVEDALHKKCDFGRSLLCGPLCISAFSAFNRYFLGRARKRYTEGRRENESNMRLFVQIYVEDRHCEKATYSEHECNSGKD